MTYPLESYVALVLAWVVFMYVHEFGHYIFAVWFKFKPKLIGMSPRVMFSSKTSAVRIYYDLPDDALKVCICSFGGIIGVIPFGIVYYLYKDPVSLIFLIIHVAYSFYEVIKRYRENGEWMRIQRDKQ